MFYFGFRQTRLGNSLTDSVLNPGSAVVCGPYPTMAEAEREREKENRNWDAAVSNVFHAASKNDADAKIEDITPRE